MRMGGGVVPTETHTHTHKVWMHDASMDVLVRKVKEGVVSLFCKLGHIERRFRIMYQLRLFER